MKYSLIVGDVIQAFEFKTNVMLVHGCNGFGAMGSGIAGTLRQRYPQIFEPYANSSLALGTITIVGPINEPERSQFIVNAITQQYAGNDGRRYADINAIRQCLEQVRAHADLMDYEVIMPMIGGGLGGIPPEEVLPVLLEYGNVYILNGAE